MTASIAELIRRIPAEALQHYFANQNSSIAAAIDWSSPNKDLVKPILKAIDELSRDDLALLDLDAERINEMTDELGQTALESVADDIVAFQQLGSTHHRALWIFLRDKEAFRRAEEIRYSEQYRLNKRMWDGFVGPTLCKLNVDDIEMAPFKDKIAEYFHCGPNVKIEIFERNRLNLLDEETHLYQIMVYREGLPDSYLAFEGTDVVSRIIRPVFEVALTYEPDSGIIEIICQCRESREDVAKIFMETMLHAKPTVERIPLKRYDLTKLLKPFDFPTDPEDGIERVKVMLLRLSQFENKNKVTLEISAKEQRTIHDVSRGWFDKNDPLLNGFLVSQSKLAIKFLPDEHSSKGETLNVTIAFPNGCNLKSGTKKERIIGEKYLQLWGILEVV